MNLNEAISLYLADRRARGIKPNTLRTEKRTLELLMADVGNIQTTSLRPQHMDIFWSRRTTWGPGSMNLARANLSSFVKWCQARGHIKPGVDPLAGGRKLRTPPRKRIIIPQEEFEPFLDGIEDPRSRIMCAIGLYMFCRVSETSALRWQDVNMHGGTAEVFRQKTETLDTLPVCVELDRELKRWARYYAAEIGRPLRPMDFVVPHMNPALMVGVPGVKGGWRVKEEREYYPDRPAHMTYAIKKELKLAGYYQEQEGGHTLRRSGAIALYNELTDMGHDRAIRICQAMLGHSTIKTTEIYLRLDLDRKVRNDLFAGKPMFRATKAAEVVQLRVVDGDA